MAWGRRVTTFQSTQQPAKNSLSMDPSLAYRSKLSFISHCPRFAWRAEEHCVAMRFQEPRRVLRSFLLPPVRPLQRTGLDSFSFLLFHLAAWIHSLGTSMVGRSVRALIVGLLLCVWCFCLLLETILKPLYFDDIRSVDNLE